MCAAALCSTVITRRVAAAASAAANAHSSASSLCARQRCSRAAAAAASLHTAAAASQQAERIASDGSLRIARRDASAATQQQHNPNTPPPPPRPPGLPAAAPSAHPLPQAALDELADLIASSRRVLALTGAGVSTASNIPDYRGPKGAYTTGFTPMTHAQFLKSAETRARYWHRSFRGCERAGAAYDARDACWFCICDCALGALRCLLHL